MASVKKRIDGLYRKQVYIGVDKDGKKKYKQFYGNTLKEASAAADAYRAAIGRGMNPELENVTFGELLERLISIKKAQGVGIRTLESYQQSKKDWSSINTRRASDLRPSDFQRELGKLADWHNGKPPLSHRTLTMRRDAAKQAYKHAIPEVISYNPLDRVTVPAGKPARERTPINETQQTWIRDTPHKAQRAAMLMLYSGLRRGEVTALTWPDIDLKAGTISVSKSFDFDAGKEKSTKTESGVRIVNIPRVLIDYLSAQQDGCMYVIHSQTGNRLSLTGWKQMWRSYMLTLNAKYGNAGKSKCTPGGLPMVIKTFTPHQLRHTFCTLLYLSGVDVMTARDQMGHANIAVTMGIYTHLDKLYKRNSMVKLDDYIENHTVNIQLENS